MKENAVISCLFYPSLVFSVRYSVYGKKGKTVTPSRRLQAKGEMCTVQTAKLCYNAININYVLVLICRVARQLNLPSVMVFRRGVCSLLVPLKLRSAVYVDTG